MGGVGGKCTVYMVQCAIQLTYLDAYMHPYITFLDGFERGEGSAYITQ